MNNILQLKGRFEQRRSPNRPGARNLPAGAIVFDSHLEKLEFQLKSVSMFWNDVQLINNALVSVYYKTVVAKSNRLRKILSSNGVEPNESIVGAKFAKDENPIKHIITHCIKRESIDESIMLLRQAREIMSSQFNGMITAECLSKINSGEIKYDDSTLKKSTLANVIVDAFYVEKFGVEETAEIIEETAIVSIYETGTDINELMRKLNIEFYSTKKIDNTTFLLDPNQYKTLFDKAPYLIAMAVKDISDFEYDIENYINEDGLATIPDPQNEPIIGVIDSPFDSSVYFSKWVEYEHCIDPAIEITPRDYLHGTKVTSLVVDGARINPELDDGCGVFRVKHFGVATGGRFSSFTVIKTIQEIVVKNPEIKVWNLSLGSILEINNNFISPEAAALDQIQYDNDVIFVIAGTNKNDSSREHMKIGAPADSINSMVVNAVTRDGSPASYSREGPVLSFYNKPDISCFGGDVRDTIMTCGPLGAEGVIGTSFAAPWISRKLAYLIHIVGLNRELAKALLIDVAVGWNKQDEPSNVLGYGVVPQNINDVITTPLNEIRFLLTGISEQFETYNFNIPVPIDNGFHPYIARATMCYFPRCSRNQGVDYTNTELDLHFGRIKDDGNIATINNNKQSDTGQQNITESKAREFYRKWDNIKYIVEYASDRKRPKKAYATGMYGISIKTKERLKRRDGEGIRFGIVVTLQDISGRNRIDEFIRQCLIKGWIVSQIDIDNKIEVYTSAEEEIVFED